MADANITLRITLEGMERVRDAERGLNRLSGATDSSSRSLGSHERSVLTASRAWSVLSGVLGGLGLATVARSIYGVSIEMESLQARIAGISGGLAAGAEEFDFVADRALHYGLNLQRVAADYLKLKAAAEFAGLSTEQVRDTFDAVAIASTGLGLSAEQVQRIMLALEQIMSKGIVTMEEIRRQMGDNLPGALGLSARAMGMTTEEFMKAVKEGRVMAEDFLPKFSAALKEHLADASERNINTAIRELERLRTSWALFVDALQAAPGIGAALRALGDVLEGWASGLSSLTMEFGILTGQIDLSDEGIQRLARNTGALRDVMGELAVGQRELFDERLLVALSEAEGAYADIYNQIVDLNRTRKEAQEIGMGQAWEITTAGDLEKLQERLGVAGDRMRALAAIVRALNPEIRDHADAVREAGDAWREYNSVVRPSNEVVGNINKKILEGTILYDEFGDVIGSNIAAWKAWASQQDEVDKANESAIESLRDKRQALVESIDGYREEAIRLQLSDEMARRYFAAVELLKEGHADLLPALTEALDALEALEAQYDADAEAAKRLKEVQSNYESTVAALRTEEEVVRDSYEQRQKSIDDHYREIENAQDEWAEMTRRNQEKLSEDLQRIREQEANEYIDLWNSTLDDIQDVWADTFKDLFHGEDPWDDFLDRMLDAFIDTFANIAAAWVTQNIFAPLFKPLTNAGISAFAAIFEGAGVGAAGWHIVESGAAAAGAATGATYGGAAAASAGAAMAGSGGIFSAGFMSETAVSAEIAGAQAGTTAGTAMSSGWLAAIQYAPLAVGIAESFRIAFSDEPSVKEKIESAWGAVWEQADLTTPLEGAFEEIEQSVSNYDFFRVAASEIDNLKARLEELAPAIDYVELGMDQFGNTIIGASESMSSYNREAGTTVTKLAEIGGQMQIVGGEGDNLSAAWEDMYNRLQRLTDGVITTDQSLAEMAMELGTTIEALKETDSNAEALAEQFGLTQEEAAALSAALEAIPDTTSTHTHYWKEVGSPPNPGDGSRHSGGPIHETGLYLLERGEHVLRKEAVRALGGQSGAAQVNRSGSTHNGVGSVTVTGGFSDAMIVANLEAMRREMAAGFALVAARV